LFSPSVVLIFLLKSEYGSTVTLGRVSIITKTSLPPEVFPVPSTTAEIIPSAESFEIWNGASGVATTQLIGYSIENSL
jgi:hypothetical protein